jgi:CheY-like chemotaxis protein
MSDPERPRLSVLAIEDDPILGRFLVDALAGAGHSVQLATTGAAALDAARRERFDLILVDLQLPDADGATLLARLRDDAGAASRQASAIAMSGELPPARRAALIAAGFLDAWQKPVSLATLESLDRHRVREPGTDALRAADATDDRLLDDDAALERLGSAATVAALRGLLAGELPRQWRSIGEAVDAGDVQAALAILHRARGGCALCGANAAVAALGGLAHALREGLDPSAARARAGAAVERTVARLVDDRPP